MNSRQNLAINLVKTKNSLENLKFGTSSSHSYWKSRMKLCITLTRIVSKQTEILARSSPEISTQPFPIALFRIQIMWKPNFNPGNSGQVLQFIDISRNKPNSGIVPGKAACLVKLY